MGPLPADSLIIIPTYNEKENIARMVATVMELPYAMHILVVDDGSPDGTAGIVKDLMGGAYAGRLHILERKGKLGLGTAYIAGFRWGLEKGYEYLLEMDADFSHNPKDTIRLREACIPGIADLVVGSRYISGGDVRNWSWDRTILSYGASWYVRMMTWMWVKDPTAGFICYHRKVLETIDLDKIKFIGYAFQIEMKFAAWTLGFKVKEVPITFIDRVEGVSKMNSSIIHEAILGVLKMRWQSFFKGYGKSGS